MTTGQPNGPECASGLEIKRPLVTGAFYWPFSFWCAPIIATNKKTRVALSLLLLILLLVEPVLRPQSSLFGQPNSIGAR